MLIHSSGLSIAVILASMLVVAGCDQEAAVEDAVDKAVDKQIEKAVRDQVRNEVGKIVKDTVQSNELATQLTGRWYGLDGDDPFVTHYLSDGTFTSLFAHQEFAGCSWGTWRIKDNKVTIDIIKYMEAVTDPKDFMKSGASTPVPDAEYEAAVWKIEKLTDEELILRFDETTTMVARRVRKPEK